MRLLKKRKLKKKMKKSHFKILTLIVFITSSGLAMARVVGRELYITVQLNQAKQLSNKIKKKKLRRNLKRAIDEALRVHQGGKVLNIETPGIKLKKVN